jgi:hypothetical protein
MLRNWVRVVAMLTLVAMIAVVVSTASAQQPRGRGRGQGGGFGGFGGASELATLNRTDVRADLGVTAEQAAKVTAALEEEQASAQDFFQSLQGVEGEERTKLLEERRAASKKAVAGILLPQQLKRFEQISLQLEMAGGGGFGGGFAFGGGGRGGPGGGGGGRGGTAGGLLSPRVVTLLTITEEQQAKIREGEPAIQRELQAKIAKANQDALEARMKAGLTADQQTKLKEAMGEPFIQTPQGGGGGRGGAGGGRGRGRGNAT